MTPAGEQFCISLRQIREDIKRAVERGQNISGRYTSSIRIGLPFRSAIPKLHEAIKIFAEERPEVSVVTDFHSYGDHSSFLSGENDLEFMLAENAENMHDVSIAHLYRSGISLIVNEDDPLASKDLITIDDLKGRRLMIGGGSPPALRKVQQRVISSGGVDFFNSPDHDTTLVNVASDRGVCLAPEFLHQQGDGFRWIPFDCEEHFDCVLVMRASHSFVVNEFAELVRKVCRDDSQ